MGLLCWISFVLSRLRVMELEADVMGHEQFFVDEAGFNLIKTRRRGRNIIGHRAIINVPGQRGGNITMCAAISQNGVVHHHATLGPYNCTQVLHCTHPPPILSILESNWRVLLCLLLKVYDRHPHQRIALLQAMEEACGDIDQASCQAWIRHSRRYFPWCLGLEDIACDVD